jgi:hypothetical protein
VKKTFLKGGAMAQARIERGTPANVHKPINRSQCGTSVNLLRAFEIFNFFG